MSNVIVVIGTGSIGQAIARRVSAGKHVLLADLRQENADAAAEVLSNAGFEVRTATVDISSRDSVQALVETATTIGDVTGVIHAAGFRRRRPRPRRSSRSISMVPHWCWKSSAMSSRAAGPPSSSHRSPATAWAR
jgi:NAD(P)-dependent dehydrogenase (short-subunit alcohol dehydrogenase family)